MDCSLQKKMKKEHAEMANPKLAGVMVTCPIIGKQICLWCCLHISDAANALSRNHTLELYPGLYEVEKVAERSFDSMSETCSRCRIKA